jgi:hypothetical protein
MGLRVFMTIFTRPFFRRVQRHREDGRGDALHVKYVVDRYGAYVDFWELMNENLRSRTRWMSSGIGWSPTI